MISNSLKIAGKKFLQQKRSSITADKKIALESLIQDLVFLPTTPVAYDDGYLTEIARMDQALIGPPIVQVHLNHTLI